MSTPGKTEFTYSCKHPGSTDLSALKPFEREGRIAWLEGKKCRACDPAKKAETAKFVAEQRRARDAEALAAEQAFGFDPMQGPPALVAWGRRVRVQLVKDAWEALDLDEAQFAELVADKANLVNRAGWWVDHKETTAANLPDLLSKALVSDDQETRSGSENPY